MSADVPKQSTQWGVSSAMIVIDADRAVLTLQATMTQLLSNLISPVSPAKEAGGIASSKLALYLSGSREDDVIMSVHLTRRLGSC